MLSYSLRSSIEAVCTPRRRTISTHIQSEMVNRQMDRPGRNRPPQPGRSGA
jgi:hypothetical protein